MTRGFSNQEFQEALAQQCHLNPPPILRQILVVYSEEGIEIFGIVDGRGGESYILREYEVLAIYENAPFAHAFHGKPIGDLVNFLGTVYLIAGHNAENLPSHEECNQALEIEQTVRQAMEDMAGRHDHLAHLLEEQRERLEEDEDTVRKAKHCHIYLFEQDGWLVDEVHEQKRLHECLRALRSSHQSRQINCLRQCYEQELEQLRTLEMEIATSVRREQERQHPLRKRRSKVLLAYEQDRQKRERQRAERKCREEAHQQEELRREREQEFNVWWAATHSGQHQVGASQAPQGLKNTDASETLHRNIANRPDEVKATPKIKPESLTLQVCPKCGCYVRPDRQEHYMTKKHDTVKSHRLTKPAHPSMGSNFAAKVTQTEDITYSTDSYDGSKGIGFLEREEGRFGSFPGHDDYEDEARP